MHMYVLVAKVNLAQCSRVEVGNVCMRLQVECSAVVREAVAQRVDGKWRVGGMWSFRTAE